MAFASLHITKPANRIIYINGDYENPAGNSSTDSITVPSGGCIAETLNGDRKVDWRKKFRVGPRDSEITIALDPVDPPQKV
ncbi:MAG TPA: hypothetical protein VGF43_22660 [Dongiaceae bacterium]|jgi:hypothetical protein